jgi:hypothetical protein
MNSSKNAAATPEISTSSAVKALLNGRKTQKHGKRTNKREEHSFEDGTVQPQGCLTAFKFVDYGSSENDRHGDNYIYQQMTGPLMLYESIDPYPEFRKISLRQEKIESEG